jgi:hypothetical protein
MGKLGIGIGVNSRRGGGGLKEFIDSMETWLFSSGFEDDKILDSSGNRNDAISRNTGSFVGDGTAYFSVDGLLTTDVITSVSSDVPTCTTNGRLDVANTDVVYGITVTRGGSVWAYYPTVEKNGVCLHDVSGNSNHGYMVSGSDSNWAVIDLPTYDYLRDHGCSRVINYDGVLKLRIIYGLLVGSASSDSFNISFNYKIDVLSDGYLLWGTGYIFRANSTTLRYRTNGNATNIDFIFSGGVPLVGSFSLEHNGEGIYDCTINGVTVSVNTTAYKLDYLYQMGWRGLPPNKGYFRNFKFTLNGVLKLDVPDFVSGRCNVHNYTVTEVAAGSISSLYIPVNQDGLTDVDGFIPTHPQNGSSAIPGTYFSLPENADLITACENAGNTFFTEGSANIIAANDIIHHTPYYQYYNWLNRNNLIIIKSDASLDSTKDLKLVDYVSCWGGYIANEFITFNSHFTPTNKAYYRSVIKQLLHPLYEDSATTGYYYDTFGPEGLRYITSAFMMLFFHNGDITAAANTPLNAGFLESTPRLNVGGDVYDSALFSNHTYNDIDYLLITSEDGFNVSNLTYSITLTMNIGVLTREIPNFSYIYNINTIDITDNKALSGDITNYLPTKNYSLKLQGTRLAGVYSNDSKKLPLNLSAQSSALSGIDFSDFSTVMTQIDIRNTPIQTGYISTLLSNLKDFFTLNTPANDLEIKFFDDIDFGSYVGYIEDEDSNADYLALQTLFTNAGYTFSILDLDRAIEVRHTDPGALNKGVVVFTHDDWYQVIYDRALPIYESKGVRATLYGTIDYIDDSTAGGDEYTHPDWGKIATWAMTEDAYARGFDLQCHGYIHGNLTAGNMILANAAWESHGIPAPQHIAYPSGGYSDEIISAIGEYRFTGRTVEKGYNGVDSELMKLKCVTLEFTTTGYVPDTDFNILKSMVDMCEVEKYALILLFHGLPLESDAEYFGANDLSDIIDYIQSKNVDIKTIKQLYDEDLS